MDITKIISVCLCGLLAVLILKQVKNEYAIYASLFINISLMTCAVLFLKPVFEYIKDLENIGFENSVYIPLMFKCASVALLCTVSSEICRDAGENSMGLKIELAGKCTIISMCLPLVRTVFDYVVEFLS